MQYRALCIDYTEDCGPNEGGYYCQVYREPDGMQIDDFCLHPDEIPDDADPEDLIRNYIDGIYDAYRREGLLEAPSPQTKYTIRPASPDEAGLFYAIPPEKDAGLGCIGHVRIDFGRGGDSFYHTWHPRGPEEWNTQDFKAELTEVVDGLRESVLKDFPAMTGYCRSHGGEISGGWVQNYGYVVETDRYSYLLRCNPIQGDYQAYLTCFDRQIQEMGQGQSKGPEIEQAPAQGITMGGM